MNMELFELLNLLLEWEEKYREGSPVVSDAVFDQCVAMYNKVAHKQGLEEYSSQLFHTVISDNAHRHTLPMISIGNVFLEEDFIAFISKIKDIWGDIDIIAEPKYDGVACALRYTSGILVGALTRGTKNQGESILDRVILLDSVPKSIKAYENNSEYIEIRGELCISKDSFSVVEGDYKTARNLLVGSLHGKDITAMRRRNAEFIAYGFGQVPQGFITTMSSYFNELRNAGFNCSDPICVSNDIKVLIDFYKNLAARNHKFNLDGVVFKVNDTRLHAKIGNTAMHIKWGIAFKFNAPEVVAEIEQVEWNVSRLGVVTPVAIIKPINIDNIKISRITLHNREYIQDKGIHTDSKVSVCRSGDVIPKINNVIISGNIPIKIPQICPCCGSRLEQYQSHLICKNSKGCYEQFCGVIDHFVHAVGAKGISKVMIKDLFKNNLITSFDSFFDLYKQKDAIISMKGWGEKSFNNLCNSIKSATSNINLCDVICAMGIKNIGHQASQVLAKDIRVYNAFGEKNPEKFFSAIVDSAICSKGLGDIAIKSINEFFELRDDIFLPIIKHVNIKKISTSLLPKHPNSGRIAFSGTMIMKRREIIEFSESYGFTIMVNITEKLDYFIVGHNPSRSKVQKARLLGITQLTEAEFISMVKHTRA